MRAWPLGWTALCAGMLGFFVCFPLTNTDIWWHLATGRWILENSQVPRSDPFVGSSGGAPWTNLHWLFQLAVLGVHRVGGVAGLVLAKTGLVGLAGALLLLGAGRQRPASYWPLAALLTAASVFVARHLALARPVVVSLLCLSLFVLVLERYRRNGRIAGLLWLLPLQVLWANAQGGLQLLGPALLLAYFVGDSVALTLSPRLPLDHGALSWRELGRQLGLLPMLLVCALLTPFGVDGLLLPFRLLGRIDPVGSELFSLNVSENIPPWLLERTAAVPLFVSGFRWVAALAFASFLLPIVRRQPLPLGRLLLLGGLFALALTANRNILLFAWLAGPITALNLAPALSRRWTRVAVTLCLAGLAALGAVRYRVSDGDPPLQQPAPFRVPDRAVDRLERLGLAEGTGPLFNSVRYGGYLIWRLFPRAYPSIDGRLVLRSAAAFAEHLDVADRPELFEAHARRRGIRTVLLPTALPGRYLRLAAHLYRDPAWRLVYTDGTQTLLVHWERDLAPGVDPLDLRAPAIVARIDQGLRQSHGQRPAVLERARTHLGRLLAAVGALDRAREVLKRCRGHEAGSLRARVLYLDGASREAQALSRALLRRHGDNVNDLLLLARIAADSGKHGEAVDLAERALAVDPHSQQARRLLRHLTRSKGL